MRAEEPAVVGGRAASTEGKPDRQPAVGGFRNERKDSSARAAVRVKGTVRVQRREE